MSKAHTGILAIALTLLPLSTVQAGEKVMYQDTIDNKPDVGVSAKAYLGDRMLEQRRGQWRECVIPKFEHRKGSVLVKADAPICKASPKSKNYTPSYQNWTTGKGAGIYDFALISGKNGSLEICLTTGIRHGCTEGKLASDYDTSPYFAYSQNSFQQTIEYSGRSGENLKFTYSEFSDGYARQAFTREFQVDISQDKVIAFKGAMIEIESATNSSITYKVVRNFQQLKIVFIQS
jgi:hypothetical protein